MEKFAGNSDSFSRFLDSQREVIERAFPGDVSLAHLDKLASALRHNDGGHNLRYCARLEISELAMLEAELGNQGFIDKSLTGMLSRQAALEASMWRWRARRLRPKGPEISVLVDVPRYLFWYTSVVNRAYQLNKDSELWSTREHFLHVLKLEDTDTFDESTLGKRFAYLDGIAAYLLGHKRQVHSNYGRGLDVVLRVLSLPSTADPATTVCLPITRAEFLKKMRELP